jgi:hypothetical protein
MAFNLSPRGTNNIKTGHGLPGGLIKPSSPLNQSKKVIDNAFRQPSKKEPSFWDSAVNAVSEAVSNVGDYFSGDTQTTTTTKQVSKPKVKQPKKIYKDTVATYAKGSLIPGSNMNYGNGTQMRIPASIGIMNTNDVFGGYKAGHQFSEYVSSSTDAERKKPLTSFINPAGSKDEKAADKAFIEHYSHPVTLKRMEKAGINPKWSYDLTKKAITTPKVNETGKPQNIVASGDVGAYVAPWTKIQSPSTEFHPYYNNNNEIDKTRGLGKTGNINYREDLSPYNPTSTKGTIQHEMAHASFADVLWPSLYKALGKKAPRLSSGQMYTPELYMNKPTEVYAHFHEFRQNLGIKPGEKINEKELIKRVNANPSVGGGKFWQEFGYDIGPDGKPTKKDKEKKAKLVNAINTVASTNGKKENKLQFSGDKNSSYA